MKTDLEWIRGQLRKAVFRGDDAHRTVIDGVSIDSRKDCAGRLFAAVVGERTDGHLYIDEAVSRGAVALLVNSEREKELGTDGPGIPVLAVDDTLAALEKISHSWCEKVKPRVLGISGTTGKTGTKELAASVLSRKYKIHSTEGNLNNHIGVPLTILAMPEGTEILVVEMGASRKKDIRHLTSIVRPDVGMITNIGYGHLEHFGSLKGVAAAKAELVESLEAGGTAVLPADDEFFQFLKKRTSAKVLTFGFSESADFRIEGVERKDKAGYRFSISGTGMETSRYGKHLLANAAAVVAAASVFGVPPEDAAPVVSGRPVVEGRGSVFDIGGVIFVDDSYNSNPSSLRTSVEAFMEMPVTGKRWLILGDMLELGDLSADLHREMGQFCGKAGADGLLTLGDLTVELSREAAIQKKAPENISHFLDVEKLTNYLESFLSEGDCVLVKGSRGMRMERVIREIEKRKETEKRRVG